MVFYNLVKAACKRIEAKYERKANKEAIRIPDERECRKCPYGRFDRGPTPLSSGYICQLNPIDPIALGLGATHSDRKKALEEREYN